MAEDDELESKFHRVIESTEDPWGGKTREEVREEIRQRKEKLDAFDKELKRKAAEKRAQQQQESQSSADTNAVEPKAE
ncbi:MAG: hypothetical protein CL610_28395 [Anaerolineaceae bacterium]|nr:hypothetical protein [Anaerolineaceae bacterium]